MQQREIRKLYKRRPKFGKVANAENYLLQYIFVEALARRIWYYYRNRSVIKKKMSHAAVPLDVLLRACRYYDIKVNVKVLRLIFDSSLRKRGEKSARNLRNELVHSWNEKDKNESVNRLPEFSSAFKKFVDAVCNDLFER